MLQRVSFPQSFCSSRCQEGEGDSPVLGRAKYAKGEVLKRDHEGGTRRDHTAHSDMSSEGGEKRRMSDKVRATAQTQNRQQHERQTGEGRAQKNPEAFSRTHRTWQGPEKLLLPKPVRPLRDFPLNYHSSANCNHNSASSKPNPSFLAVLCYWTIQTGACLWYSGRPGKSMTFRKRMPTPHRGQLHIHHTVRGTILSPTSPLYLKSQLPIKEKPALLWSPRSHYNK